MRPSPILATRGERSAGEHTRMLTLIGCVVRLITTSCVREKRVVGMKGDFSIRRQAALTDCKGSPLPSANYAKNKQRHYTPARSFAYYNVCKSRVSAASGARSSKIFA